MNLFCVICGIAFSLLEGVGYVCVNPDAQGNDDPHCCMLVLAAPKFPWLVSSAVAQHS